MIILGLTFFSDKTSFSYKLLTKLWSSTSEQMRTDCLTDSVCYAQGEIWFQRKTLIL